MTRLNKSILTEYTVKLTVQNYVRILPKVHAATPLGMGYGKTRFASPDDAFKVIYLASTQKTALAETLLRDRFQGRVKRRMMAEEFDDRSITAITTSDSFRMLDVRGDAAMLLNVPTDAISGRNQKAGRAFSRDLHDQTRLDGILYSSRFTRQDCVMLYERAVIGRLTASPAVDLVTLKALPAILKDELKVEIIRRTGI